MATFKNYHLPAPAEPAVPQPVRCYSTSRFEEGTGTGEIMVWIRSGDARTGCAATIDLSESEARALRDALDARLAHFAECRQELARARALELREQERAELHRAAFGTPSAAPAPEPAAEPGAVAEPPSIPTRRDGVVEWRTWNTWPEYGQGRMIKTAHAFVADGARHGIRPHSALCGSGERRSSFPAPGRQPRCKSCQRALYAIVAGTERDPGLGAEFGRLIAAGWDLILYPTTRWYRRGYPGALFTRAEALSTLEPDQQEG